MPASKTARYPKKRRGRPAVGGAKKGKKKLAGIPETVAAVESVTGRHHTLIGCPVIADADRGARDLLLYALRAFAGCTQKMLCEMYGLWPSQVVRAQKRIRLATQNPDRRSFRPELRETLDTIQFVCRQMYHISTGERGAGEA